MRKKIGILFAMITFCLLLNVFPAMAGEWHKTGEDQWQYMKDDGSKATGWLEIDGNRYYFDENGNRKSDYWLKDDGSWYYLDEDGVMARNTWVDNYHVDNSGRFEKKR